MTISFDQVCGLGLMACGVLFVVRCLTSCLIVVCGLMLNLMFDCGLMLNLMFDTASAVQAHDYGGE